MPELTPLSIGILALAGTCLHASLTHALTARVAVEPKLHAQFALAAFLVALLALSVPFTYSPSDAQQWLIAFEFQAALVCVLWPLFSLFLANYSGFHHRPVLVGIALASAALLGASLATPGPALFSHFEGIRWLELGGARYAYGAGTLGWQYVVYVLLGIVAGSYAMLGAVVQVRRGERRRGVKLALALTAFWGILVVDALIDLRAIEAPTIGPFAFIALVLLMSHRLAEDLRGALDKRARDLEAVNVELRASEEKLMRSQRMDAFGQLAGGVAHDFNNLLTAILGHSALLRSRIVRRGVDAHVSIEPLDEVDDAARRAAALTQQLLVFSRKQLSRARDVEADAVILRLRGMLERLVREDIEFRVECGAAGAVVHMDPTHLEQIVVNLVVNASDAMTSGGTLRVSTEITGDRTPAYVVRVADTGAGMDEETRSRAFEPFFTTKPLGEGTGLGLATVHATVDKAGGRTGIESQLGRGTTVTVMLPLVEGVDAVDSTADRTSHIPITGGGQHILVCEDEPAVMSFTRDALEAGGYRVTACSDPARALAEFDGPHAPHLLVTDVVMPKMNGPDLVGRITELRGRVPVLFVSGYTAGILARHGLAVGDTEFLAKPFTAEQLLKQVARLLPGARCAAAGE